MFKPSTIYAAAIAAGLLAYLFLRRRGWLKAFPVKGSRLSEFGEFIRLRDVFRMAVLMEEEGRAFLP